MERITPLNSHLINSHLPQKANILSLTQRKFLKLLRRVSMTVIKSFNENKTKSTLDFGRNAKSVVSNLKRKHRMVLNLVKLKSHLIKL